MNRPDRSIFNNLIPNSDEFMRRQRDEKHELSSLMPIIASLYCFYYKDEETNRLAVMIPECLKEIPGMRYEVDSLNYLWRMGILKGLAKENKWQFMCFLSNIVRFVQRHSVGSLLTTTLPLLCAVSCCTEMSTEFHSDRWWFSKIAHRLWLELGCPGRTNANSNWGEMYDKQCLADVNRVTSISQLCSYTSNILGLYEPIFDSIGTPESPFVKVIKGRSQMHEQEIIELETTVILSILPIAIHYLLAKLLKLFYEERLSTFTRSPQHKEVMQQLFDTIGV